MRTIDISPGDMETVMGILRVHAPGREVWVFGSRITGSAKPFSDLDLAVMGDKPLPSSALAEMKESFSESNLPFKVDVVEWADTSPQFRKIIEDRHEVLQEAAQTHG